MYEAGYSSKQLSLFENLEEEQTGRVHDFSCGKTSPAPSQATKEWTFIPCLKKLEKPHFQYLPMHDGQTRDWWNCQTVTLRGASSTLNIGECPNVDAESSLSRILEPRQDVRAKYYLSPKACEGILRRARERGKELPPELKEALERQSSAAWWRRALLERLRRLLEASGMSKNYRQR